MLALTLTYLKHALGFVHASEQAQDAFEYLLVIGGVSAVIVLAMVTPVGNTIINAVIRGTCLAINTVVPLTCP